MPASPVIERANATPSSLVFVPSEKPAPVSNNSPVSPDNGPAALLMRMQLSQQPQRHRHQQQHPPGKPPISPPSIEQRMPRMSPIVGVSKSTMPGLTRLPSLTARPTLTQHEQHHNSPVHCPSVVSTPQSRAPHSITVSPGNPTEAPSTRELAARLALLLHARECCTPLDTERLCGVRNCRVARGVLDHCQECFLAEGQCHRSCSESKQLLRHFRVCRAQNFERGCSICDTLRTEFAWAMHHARSLTPLFVQREDEPRPQHAAAGANQYAPQRRHSHQPDSHTDDLLPSLRRSVSEGPHATMSAMGHHKRSGPAVYGSMEPELRQPTVKRVRIVTPTEEAARAAVI